jgi:alkylhydroperoxidase/carboxymuconolactone decarboxylase family protein YurZ
MFLLIISGLPAKSTLLTGRRSASAETNTADQTSKGDSNMALYRTVSEKEATGKVKKVYKDIMATKKIDFVPNFWKALSINPDHLEVTWQKLKAVMKPGKLDLRTKEIIALAVSITNNCEY